MTKRFVPNFLAALSAVAFIAIAGLYVLHPAQSSDHQDSPAMVARPGADITDVFLFPSASDRDKVVLAMDVHPLIPQGMGSSTFFDPGVMYQFKIDNAGDHKEHLVLQFKANGGGADQTLSVYGPSKPNMMGTASTWVGETGTVSYNKISSLPNGMKIFAGPAEDPFYFDLAQFFKIIPDRNFKNQPNPPAPSADCFRKPGEDFLSNNGFNVLTLVVEMPRAMLAFQGGKPGRIGVWATTSVVENTPAVYTQVERLSRPAVKEAFEMFASHDRTNRSSPYDDPLLPTDIYKFMTDPRPAGAGRSPEIAKAVEGVLIPDEMTADLAAPGGARYLAVETRGKSGLPISVIRLVPNSGIYGIKKALGDPYRHFGGRDFASPVIDISLGAIFGSLVPKLGLAAEDHRETACLTSDNVTPAGKHFRPDFPYIGEPR